MNTVGVFLEGVGEEVVQYYRIRDIKVNIWG